MAGKKEIPCSLAFLLDLVDLLLGGIPHRPVEVVRVAKLAVLRRLVGCPPAVVRHREVEDEGAVHPIVAEVARDLHVSALIAFAGGDGRLYSHGMTERAEERLELRDGPIVCLRGSTHRRTTLNMIGLVTKVMLTTGAECALSLIHI